MRKRKGNLFRGFVSFDALFSVLVVILMLVFLMNFFTIISENIDEKINRQQKFDRVAGIADFLVKKGAVKKQEISPGNTLVYPNWIDENELAGTDLETLEENSGLENLYIGLDSRPDDRKFCIYRLVVVGEEKKIGKLFVCGD